MSENKTGKYLKYAIGEIILVVIGILIALQINNWNENRKDRAQVKTYYKQLMEELNLDVQTINFSIARLENDKKLYQSIKDALKTPNLPIDSILKIYEKAGFIIDNSSFNTKTIEVLLSTGDIKLITPKIKNALLTLQNEQLDHIRDSNSRLDFYIDTFSNLIFLRPFNKKFLNEQKILSENLNAKQKMIEEIPLLNKSLIDRNRSNEYDLLELNNVLNLTQELIRFITEELEYYD